MRYLYSFFYHYNKPLSKQRGKPQISIHWRGWKSVRDFDR